jgi:signal transduction histidine kinase
VYFLLAELAAGLYGETNWVAVFWPAFGISAGTLIALGPSARWPVAAGVIIAILVLHLIAGNPGWLGPTYAIADAAEALVTAGLIHHFFGPGFSLGRLSHVIGLLAAAVAGIMVSFAVWIGPSTQFQNSTEPILTKWQHWFMSDVAGFAAFGPFVIGLIGAARQPPERNELIEGIAALIALALITALIILLPLRTWQTLVPVSWLFPIFFWLAARCRPVFAAAGACMVCIAIVWTTVFGIGYFGSAPLSVDDRNLQAQATILVIALGALILAALFAERRDSEARLARSNAMLERERDNKLLNAQAITAAIAHEVSQPLGAIELNGEAGLDFLSKTPPDLGQIRSILNDVITAGRRTSEVIGDIRTLFGRADHRERGPVDVNALILGILRSLGAEFEQHEVETSTELTPELPFVDGNSGQLHEVIYNLVRNAVEAMGATTNRAGLLRVRTELRGRDAIAIAVEDTGPGIEPTKLSGIFDAFTTTKSDGMGLGLAICRMISEHHGGQLTASSDGKSGSLFLFVLPIASIRGHSRSGAERLPDARNV